MVVTAWGNSGSFERVNNIPLWVKISNIPDSYWTVKGLSRLASVVGKPICADSLTSKLEVLPFAKVCVKYDLNHPLPNSIKVMALDPYSNEKVITEVLFSYPNKPLMCTGCQSLGHMIGAYPNVSRSWVEKNNEGPYVATEHKDQETCTVTENLQDKILSPEQVNPTPEPLQPQPVPNIPNDPVVGHAAHSPSTSPCDEGWKTINTKKKKSSTPSCSDKSVVNLPIYNSLSRTFAKNQKSNTQTLKSRAKPAMGQAPPS